MAIEQPRKSTRFSRWRERRHEKARRASRASSSMGGGGGSSTCLDSILLTSDVRRARDAKSR
jgi:hypothetical protein